MLTAAERALGLGATDVTAIVGVSPYRAPIDVYREKVGLSEGMETSARMRWGQLLQEAVADGYQEQTGRRLFEHTKPLRHKLHTFLYGHPDYFVYEEPGVVEVKTGVTRQGYGDEPPPHVRVQCQWYMGLSDRDWCDVALLSGTSRLDIFRVERDRELFEALVDAAVGFWAKHVVPQMEPEPDSTDAYRRHLAERFPRSTDIELVATSEQALLVDELRLAKEAVKAAEGHEMLLENRIRLVMGEAGVLLAPGGRITWRKNADTERTDWKLVAHAYRTLLVEHDAAIESQLESLTSVYTQTVEGPRVLRCNFPKAESREAA